jgi:thiamine pyrophosphate-dependent acetolactate synthase large subunit-like protein
MGCGASLAESDIRNDPYSTYDPPGLAPLKLNNDSMLDDKVSNISDTATSAGEVSAERSALTTPPSHEDSSPGLSGESRPTASKFEVKSVSFDTPPMEQMRQAMQDGLRAYFAHVEVNLVQCPDLTQYGAAAPGICGGATLLDLGHVRNLLEPHRHATTFQLPEVLDALGLPFSDEWLILGAGEATSASGACAGCPGELVLNEVRNKRKKWCSSYSAANKSNVSRTHSACSDGPQRRKSRTFSSMSIPDNNSVHPAEFNDSGEVGLFAQALVSRGEPGIVLEVSCKQRITEETFPNAIRHSLKPLGTVGMGGMFTVSGANSQISTLHSLPAEQINNVDELFQQSVKFGELVGDARCFTTLISSENVRGYGHEHTHCEGVSDSTGGHWWTDLDGLNAEYHGFFVPADKVTFVENQAVQEQRSSDASHSVADEIVDWLAESGVNVVFGGHGAAIAPMIESIGRNSAIEWVYTRHEGSSALMAAALAKFTSETQVCLSTAGPGALNLSTGLVDAQQDRLPVLAITGTLAQNKRGLAEFQDVDQAGFFKQMIPLSLDITGEDRALPLIKRCFKQAKANSHVAHVSMPVNIQKVSRCSEPDVPGSKKRNSVASQSSLSPFGTNAQAFSSKASQEEVASRLLAARYPLVVLGIRALDCSDALFKLLESYPMPVIYTVDGKGCISDKHSCVVGGWGVFGHPAIHESHAVLLKSDLVLMVGCSECQSLIMSDGVQVRSGIIVETPAHAQEANGSEVFWDTVLGGDIPASLDGITEYLHQNASQKAPWHSGFTVPALVRPRSPGNYCHPSSFFASFNRVFCAPNSAVAVDVGDVTVWTVKYLQLEPGARLLSSQNLGTMGYGLCGAIAVKLHSPHFRCAAICGDGGFAMTLAELAVAKQHNLGIVVVVFNNQKMGRVANGCTQDMANSGTELANPNFVELATAFGGHGMRIDGASDVDACVERALQYTDQGTFVILDVVIDPDLNAPFCSTGELEALA